MSRLQSVDDIWNSYADRRSAIESAPISPFGRGPSQATAGVEENVSGFWGTVSDVVKGVPRGVWGAADSIMQMLYYGTGGIIGNDEREAPFGVEAWRGHSQTIPGSISETVAQVYLPFGAGMKAVKATTKAVGLAGYGTAATAALGEEAVIAAAAGQRARAVGLAAAGRGIEMVKAGATGVAAGAIADTLAFESHAQRLSNFLTTFDNPLLNNSLTQYMAADEDDTFLEGKFKNALEGALFSGAVESIIGSARVIRAGMRASRIGSDANAAMFAEHMTIRREQREQIMGSLGVTADEAEVVNAVIDATGMSRKNLEFARSAEELVDEAGQPRRASVTFKQDGQTLITFFKTADRTSPVHEVSHVVRRRLLDRTIAPEHRFGITDLDIKVIEDFVGVREGTWDVMSEERWAALFERFTWDGIAPNRKVAAVMDRAADFMRAVYTRLDADDLLRQADPERYAASGGVPNRLEINPEVRRVMNKLMSRGPVTTDDAIRTFVGAKRKGMVIPGSGRLYRTMQATLEQKLDERQSVQAFESLYDEPTLYQSKKAKMPSTSDPAYPVKRGREEVLDRVRREVNQGSLDRADADAMEKFIRNLPDDVLDAQGVRFRKSASLGKSQIGGVTLGTYNRGSNIVSIASDWMKATKVRETWSHEWVHALTSFMPDEVLNLLKSDYTRAYQKFIRLEGIDPRAKPGTNEFTQLTQWMSKNPNRYEELYSLTNLDEFLAVGLQTKLWKQLDIQENTRSFLGYARYALHNAMVSIKATAGKGTFDRIAREIMDADYRMAKKRRDSMLDMIGMGDLARKDAVSVDATFGNWMQKVRDDLDNRRSYMFRDYQAAQAARTEGEILVESTVYRDWNKLDLSAEQRVFGGTGPAKKAPQTTTLFQSARTVQPPEGMQRATRYTVGDRGLLNNQVLDYARLTDEEEAEVIQLLNYGLEQPRGVSTKAEFYFTDDGLSKNARLIELLKKAAKGPVKETTVFAPKTAVWSSRDGQIAVMPKSVQRIDAGNPPETLFQSAFQGQGAPLPQPLRQPLGGQPPQRPINIARTSTAQEVRDFIDIRVQELEADGRVAINTMTREEMIAAGERELMQVADFTGYRTLPELNNALRANEDALQGFVSRHMGMRMALSETGTDLIRSRDLMMQSNSDVDIARFVALQQRYDVLLEHVKRNQATIGRGLNAQNIIPGNGAIAVRLVDESMLNDPAMVTDIIEAAGGRDAVMAMARVSQAAEARGGIAGAVRATNGGRHGVVNVLTEYWMNSILSGPITFATNITSNAVASLYLPLEQALGASLTRNMPLMRESLMRYGALFTEVRDALHYAGITLRTGDNILDLAGTNLLTGQATQRNRAISAASMRMHDNTMLGSFVNMVGTVVNAPSSALQATDEFFKQLNYRSTVKAGLMADAMTEAAAGRLPRDQMGAWVETNFQRMVDQGQMYSQQKIRADANNAARREIQAGTFTENSAEHLQFVREYVQREWNPNQGALATRARDISREATFTTPLRRDRPGLEGISAKIQNIVAQHPSMRILVPFVRTPTNLALFFGQRLPINGVMYATPGLRDVSTRFSRDMASADPVVRAAAAGRMAGGSIITVSALMMAMNGTITGSGPKDPEERAYMMKAGWQPYSIKVGNTYISYRKLDPFATFFGMAADLHEAYVRGDEEQRGVIETTLMGLTAAIANNIANKTYLTGLVNASNAISDAERNGAQYVNTFVASFIPSLSSQSNELFFEDTAMRDVQTISDAVRARIPGLAEKVAPRRDVMGEVIRKPDRIGLLPPAWPFAFSQSKKSAIIENELAALGAGFTPPRSMRNDVDLRTFVNRKGQTSYDRWQELTGKVRLNGRTLRESMEQAIQSPTYQALDPTGVPGYESPRVAALRKLISQYRDAAFRETAREFPDLMEAERNRRATVIGARSGKPFAELLQYSRGR